MNALGNLNGRRLAALSQAQWETVTNVPIKVRDVESANRARFSEPASH